MIESPMQACRRRGKETAGVVIAIMLALMLPGWIGIGGMLAESTATQWLTDYTPIVYLRSGVSDESREALTQEIEGWSVVEKVKVRNPQEAHADLEERLGDAPVRELGVTPSMLPTSLVIEPAAPLVGHIDLVSRLSAIEPRMEIETVEVPSSTALRVVVLAGVSTALGGILGLIALAGATLLLFSYLRRLSDIEGDVDDVLEIFGAYPSQVRRPTIWRGAVLGAWVGVGVSVCLTATVLLWQSYSPALFGVETPSVILTWPLAVSPLLLVPMWGWLVGVFAARGRSDRSRVAPRILLAAGAQ